MFHKTFFITIILSLVGLGIFIHHFFQTSELLNKYQKLGFVQSDIKYDRVEKSWGEQGLIFYQVQFPFVNIPIQSDQMRIHLSDSGMNLKLKNAKINVIEGLKNVYGSEIAKSLNTYVPYRDFFNHIMITLASMGIDEFIGDISVNTLYSDIKTMRFNIQMEQEKQPTLQMSGTIHIPVVGAHQLSDLWNGKIDSLDLNIEKSYFQKYLNYAKSKNIRLPEYIHNGQIKLKEKTRQLLPSFQSIFKQLTRKTF
ncbi:MAG: hypothetical protein J6T55_01030 [Alphaproteobacteria bacterium]|nr:hypothetical protein [Alphaproteobacteria bacterium]